MEITVTFLEECIEYSGPAWSRFTHHQWINAMFAGELSEERFKFWLIQDLPYLGEHIALVAAPKVPPNNPWVSLQKEYERRSTGSRVELRVLNEMKDTDFAQTRWAARPQREAIINFWLRTVYEGTFGDICSAFYVCYSFSRTFGERLKREKTTGLSELQMEWVEQWVDPFYEELRSAAEAGLNEYGSNATDYERSKMLWIFLRATQHQIGTFDAAWNLSDPWPGEGDEIGALAGMPNATEKPHLST